MRKIFLDTNILVDLVANRMPFGKYAAVLFDAAESKKLKLYTSSHSIATTHYLLKKFVPEKQLRALLLDLTELVTIVPVDDMVLQRGLRSHHKDFEDAIQITCATSVPKMECIVTRNLSDFKGSEIPVWAPDQVAATL